MTTTPHSSDFVPLAVLTRDPQKKRFWSNIDEYHGVTPPPEEDCEGEEAPLSELSRRRFLELAAASFALGGVTGCTRQPTELIRPYVNPPENITPGRPKYYATAVPVGGVAQGVIVESHLGRPTKIEGNPAHPASLGATSVHSQASVLDLYDPDRPKVITRAGEDQSWTNFLNSLAHLLAPIQAKAGAGRASLRELLHHRRWPRNCTRCSKRFHRRSGISTSRRDRTRRARERKLHSEIR